MIEALMAILAASENIAKVVGDLAQKEAFTDEQKVAIKSRLDSSRARLEEIYAKAEAPPE